MQMLLLSILFYLSISILKQMLAAYVLLIA